jgi:hypothetical protein
MGCLQGMDHTLRMFLLFLLVLVVRATMGTYFPVSVPRLGTPAPITPRTLDCNMQIQRIIAREKERKVRGLLWGGAGET